MIKLRIFTWVAYTGNYEEILGLPAQEMMKKLVTHATSHCGALGEDSPTMAL